MIRQRFMNDRNVKEASEFYHNKYQDIYKYFINFASMNNKSLILHTRYTPTKNLRSPPLFTRENCGYSHILLPMSRRKTSTAGGACWVFSQNKSKNVPTAITVSLSHPLTYTHTHISATLQALHTLSLKTSRSNSIAHPQASSCCMTVGRSTFAQQRQPAVLRQHNK